jgi:hypothetical protein
VILDEAGNIICWMESPSGVKMMEHAYLCVPFMLGVEDYLAGKPVRVVWIGDYAGPEPKKDGDRWSRRGETLRDTVDAIEEFVKKNKYSQDLKEKVGAAEALLKKSVLERFSVSDNQLIKYCLDAKDAAEQKKNLYHMCDDLPELKYNPINPWWNDRNKETFIYINEHYPFIVNHTRKEYVDKRRNTEMEKLSENKITSWPHPLALLTCETASGGGGDYYGDGEIDVGIWARDLISMESKRPGDDYKEFVVGFREC